MKNQTITDRITWLRHTLGATQAEFSERCGINFETLRRIERGQALRDTQILRIANALQIDPGWLLTGDARYLALLPANQSSALFANAGIQAHSIEKTFFNIYPHLQP